MEMRVRNPPEEVDEETLGDIPGVWDEAVEDVLEPVEIVHRAHPVQSLP